MNEQHNSNWGRNGSDLPLGCFIEKRGRPSRKRRRPKGYGVEPRAPRMYYALKEKAEWCIVAPTEAEGNKQSDVLVRLDAAVKSKDERAFITVIRETDWSAQTPTVILRAISLAVKGGLPRAARHIAEEGSTSHPHDIEIQQQACLFAPARVLPQTASSVSNQNANIAWLKAHGGEYLGKWVALKDGQLLGAETKLKELVQKIGVITDVMLTPSY